MTISVQIDRKHPLWEWRMIGVGLLKSAIPVAQKHRDRIRAIIRHCQIEMTIPVEIREQAGLLPHTEVNFEFDGKTVQQLRDELTATTGENVVIRRFARFAIGQ